MTSLPSWARVLVGAGIWALVPAIARAEAPGVYYSWRSLETSVSQCLTQAQTALQSQSLGDIEMVSNSIAGRSPDATAVFVCLDNGDGTTVMVIVSSTDDQTAMTLREALKSAF